MVSVAPTGLFFFLQKGPSKKVESGRFRCLLARCLQMLPACSPCAQRHCGHPGTAVRSRPAELPFSACLHSALPCVVQADCVLRGAYVVLGLTIPYSSGGFLGFGLIGKRPSDRKTLPIISTQGASKAVSYIHTNHATAKPPSGLCFRCHSPLLFLSLAIFLPDQ